MNQVPASMARIKFPPVGRCIYCNKDTGILTDEHIVAYAIAGNWMILPNSSCPVCQKETTRSENHCFGQTLKPFREQIGLKSRNRKEKIKSLGLPVSYDKKTFDLIDFPVEKYPAFLMLPHLKSMPTILEARAAKPCPEIDAWGINTQENTLGQFKGARVGAVPFHAGHWLRMIAKIAHSYAVAQRGLDRFRPLLQKVILGRDQNFSHYIGAMSPDRPPPDTIMHRIEIGDFATTALPAKRYVCVSLRLFGKWGSPAYIVAVGESI